MDILGTWQVKKSLHVGNTREFQVSPALSQMILLYIARTGLLVYQPASANLPCRWKAQRGPKDSAVLSKPHSRHPSTCADYIIRGRLGVCMIRKSLVRNRTVTAQLRACGTPRVLNIDPRRPWNQEWFSLGILTQDKLHDATTMGS